MFSNPLFNEVERMRLKCLFDTASGQKQQESNKIGHITLESQNVVINALKLYDETFPCLQYAKKTTTAI